MTRIGLPVLLLITAAVYLFYPASSPDSFELEEGYRYLYGDESLEGWRVVGGGATFEADGDEIVGRHGAGGNTFLRTARTFDDFSLKLQVRWEEPGNAGVMFRAGQRDGDGRVYGYQYELDPSARAWSGGIYDEARRGWLADLRNNPEARAAVRLDDWNDVTIEARGTSLKTWINGVPAADIVDGLDARGFIALQVHAGDSGVMRWRRIRLKELPGMAAPGASLLVPREWRARNIDAITFEDNALAGSLVDAGGWLGSRRLFDDVMIRMTIPACDQPTIVRMRSQSDDNTAFAEVVIHAGRAEGRVVTPAGERRADAVLLAPAGEYELVGITRGGSIVFTVGEKDVLRLEEPQLPRRGQLRIRPGRCDERFRIAGLEWFSLMEQNAGLLFYATLDTAPAPVLSPAQALDAFSLAPGFEIELVAAEPLVAEPVAMAWDEYGRLYVVEMRGYMRDAYGGDSDAPVGQVVRLSDTDGDGRMDRSEVFLGGLVNPRAVAVVNAGVLIGEPPNLWLCELPAPEALCTNKRRVGDYAPGVDSPGVDSPGVGTRDVATPEAQSANVEHLENGLYPGLDNWLYNAKSDRQLRLVNGQLQVRRGLFRGQWGIGKDNVGRWFYNHNSTWLQADLFHGEDLVVAGAQEYPKGLGVNLTDPAEVFSVRVNPGVNRAYLEGTLREDGRLHRATGVSGLAVYRGDQFPDAYIGDVFVPEVAGNVVARFSLAERGMELTASQHLYPDAQWGQRAFLGSTDERFRPVDAMNGPDGALYIIDMYRGIIQDDHFLTDQLREQIFQRRLEAPLGLGRIWRVRHREGDRGRAPVVLADAGESELVAALSHPNGWVRDTAQRLLLGRGGELTEALEAVARGARTVPALHAVWTLAGRGELRRDLVMRLAARPDRHRQVQALRAGSALLGADDVLALAGQLSGAPEAVRVQLAFAMGVHSDDARVRGALTALVHADDRSVYLRQAVVRAVRGREVRFLRELFVDGHPRVAGEGNAALLRALAANAYRALRGDVGSDQPAPALRALLTLAASRDGDRAWQQIAMLEGFADVTADEGFVPASLTGAPPIFSDGSIGEEDPLWSARLSGRRAFTWPGDVVAMGLQPLSPEQLRLVAKGKAFYPKCAACHGEQGAGIKGLAPPLAGTSWVAGPPEWLGRIILQGMTGPVTVKDEMFEGLMPAHGDMPELDDATLAGLMTFLRRSWGNTADPVGVDEVAAIRRKSSQRYTPWTADELREVPYDRGFARFEGRYSLSFVTLTIEERPAGLFVSAPLYGGAVLDRLGESTFRASRAGESLKLEFVASEDGAVDELVLYRNGEKLNFSRKR